jgi:hypothetical protein
MAAQLTDRKGPVFRGEPSWMRRAIISLPVPLSPRIMMEVEESATRPTRSRISSIFRFLHTMESVANRRLSSLFSDSFSASSRARSTLRRWKALTLLAMRDPARRTKSFSSSRASMDSKILSTAMTPAGRPSTVKGAAMKEVATSFLRLMRVRFRKFLSSLMSGMATAAPFSTALPMTPSPTR